MKRIINFFKSYIDIFVLNIKEHIENVPQMFKLSIADLKKTYTGAALGWAWAVIKPVVTIFVYWFAIAIGLRQGSDIDGVPYILWLIAGITAWSGLYNAIWCVLLGTGGFVLWHSTWCIKGHKEGPLGPWLCFGHVLLLLDNLYQPLWVI